MPALIKRTDGNPEWSLVWPSLRGPDEKQRGYIVTTDPERAKWWARFYERGQGSGDKFERDEYVKAQAMARLDHEAWLAAQPVSSGTTGGLSTHDRQRLENIELVLAELPKQINDDAARRLAQ